MTGGGGGGGGSGGASPSSPTADRSNPHHHQQQQQMGNNDDSIREVHSRFELYASQLAQVRVGVVLRTTLYELRCVQVAVCISCGV